MNECIEIELGHDLVALVSQEDADLIALPWYAADSKSNHPHARCSRGQKKIEMHRVILERMNGGQIPAGIECDHINHNTLDNRRSNLRQSTKVQNLQNRRGWGKYGRGVRYHPPTKKYVAHIVIGSYETVEEAEEAWLHAAQLLRGEFAIDETKGK